MTNNRTYKNYSRYNVSSSRSSGNSAQYSRSTGEKYSHKHIKKDNRKRKRKNTMRFIVALAILFIIGVIVYICFPINVKVNGKEATLTYDKTLKKAVADTNTVVKPGNFIAVDYSVITPGQGNPYYAECDGQEIDENTKLQFGDEVSYSDGKDIMEEYDHVDTKISAKSEIKGVGAIHKLEGSGEPGIWSKLTGKVSGIYTERQTKNPENVTCTQYNINPGNDKVIALTFDDGPSDEYTGKILDLLKKYSAHATFFVIGERIEEKWGKNLVAREQEEGHQVCTHTYDHARAAGGTDITLMSAEKQIEEVTKGKSAIAKAIKGDVSSVVRLPGGNLSELTCRIIAPYVSAEIGWNVDTGDWKMPGSNIVLQHLKLASAGDVVLCHDGGGDRSDTVEALGQFLKEYNEKGYKFITIDELMKYSPAKQKSN